ncbi:dTDP-4-dehydrorhamnose 3,5-epimerase [Paenibacillus radicis (ex Xue et al. 2023)]|uniref:dTDP-4-dehydrorhamnose 3,5-epimerase n=1 Tax=Paenibacillus radicis (ex Xue et al. 2023) TaxID=2972489 RepID=A0ABT1YPC3_9BACL|nr:dTDP-4-dehydrorhamnose 3,5-epimerase [Paenibacillus radicis (ex Xue et al. 2023)]MCR8635036.1 dTDP-4-dehydrorhamnose 3,5-epimerase [Paenibacillus radicis (ex Xue et al. 2023)]
MKFTETSIAGAYVIDIEPSNDERGFFARSWCVDEYAQYGLNTNVVQCGISYNWYKGTIRGLHYQEAPFTEAKTIRCTKGAVYDVILDIRPQSTTYKQWLGIRLTAANRSMLYVPEGVAHGFQTLEDDTELTYLLSQRYEPASARGVRWNDPAFCIQWLPMEALIISDRDQQFELWREGAE